MVDRQEDIRVEDELTRRAAAERSRIVAQHTPRAIAIFCVFGLIGGVLEWLSRPTHRVAVLLAALLYPTVIAVHVLVIRRNVARSVTSLVLAINGMCAVVLLYSVLTRGKGELIVMALSVMLGACAVLFPIGTRNQLLASLMALIGYPIAMQLGPTLTSAWWYGGLALVAIVSVFAIGAGLIDEYRTRVLGDAITQQALAAEKARLVDEVRAAESARAEFFATISHELRTPLSVILGYTDLLLDDAFEPHEQHDVQRRIREQADLMLNLVQALLDLNRLRSGHVRLNIEDFDLGELLERVQRNLPSSWRGPQVELEWTGPAQAIPMRTDSGKLEMIVRNLVHNALKYTRRGRVSVRTEASETEARFLVSDTGEGIAPEDLPNIFAMFGQGTRTSARGGGVGLGLHIVKRFTEALGGAVSVESKPGEGTVFTVAVPRQLVEPQATRDPPAAGETAETSKSAGRRSLGLG